MILKKQLISKKTELGYSLSKKTEFRFIEYFEPLLDHKFILLFIMKKTSYTHPVDVHSLPGTWYEQHPQQ